MHELTVLTDPLSEKVDQELLGRVRGVILNLGGEITKEDTKEKQKLSYAIQKHTLGFYTIFEFNIPSENMEELQKQINLEASILRFLIVDIQKMKKEQAKPKIAKPIRHIETKSDDKGEKVKIEEIDKKLEEILKE